MSTQRAIAVDVKQGRAALKTIKQVCAPDEIVLVRAPQVDLPEADAAHPWSATHLRQGALMVAGGYGSSFAAIPCLTGNGERPGQDQPVIAPDLQAPIVQTTRRALEAALKGAGKGRHGLGHVIVEGTDPEVCWDSLPEVLVSEKFGQEFATALRTVLPTRGTDETRPILCGVGTWRDHDGGCHVESTDTYRLARYSLTAEEAPRLLPCAPGEPREGYSRDRGNSAHVIPGDACDILAAAGVPAGWQRYASDSAFVAGSVRYVPHPDGTMGEYDVRGIASDTLCVWWDSRPKEVGVWPRTDRVVPQADSAPSGIVWADSAADLRAACEAAVGAASTRLAVLGDELAMDLQGEGARWQEGSWWRTESPVENLGAAHIAFSPRYMLDFLPEHGTSPVAIAVHKNGPLDILHGGEPQIRRVLMPMQLAA